MTPKNTLLALLALMFACGLADAMYDAEHMRMPIWWALFSGLLSNFLPFYWYRLDSEARRFRRSRWMSSAVVAVSPLAIPFYLLRSRAPGARLVALARMSAYLALMLGATIVGALAFFVMPG